MAQALFRVGFAGPHITVQDGGRFGYLRYGAPASGPMDRTSFRIANGALGRDLDSAAIEVSVGGLTLECLDGQLSYAVAGGGFVVGSGDQTFGSWTRRRIKAGQSISIRPGPWGSWTYLAFAGDLEAKTWLDRAATHSMSGLGGGRLVAGSEFTINDTRVLDQPDGAITCPVFARPQPNPRVVMGPQEHCFEPLALEMFESRRFILTDAYDRMGVRLQGPRLELRDALSIPSEPILRGSVQVSGAGVPTVLLADHGTTGGYPKIATLLSHDLDRFVQLRPRDAVAFHVVSPAEAIEIARHEQQLRAAFEISQSR